LETQETLVLIKPDAFAKGIVDEVALNFRKQHLKIVKAKLIQPNRKLMEKLYQEHREKPFFGELIGFMTSGLILALCLQGENAVKRVREINEAIRKAHASHDCLSANVVHGSDSLESAARELEIFFGTNNT
jgi:nucleoside-diphosphate kinase